MADFSATPNYSNIPSSPLPNITMGGLSNPNTNDTQLSLPNSNTQSNTPSIPGLSVKGGTYTPTPTGLTNPDAQVWSPNATPPPAPTPQVPKPTTVVSSQPQGVTTAQNVVNENDQAYQNKRVADAFKTAADNAIPNTSKFMSDGTTLNPNYVTPPVTTPTAPKSDAEVLASQPSSGMSFAYDNTGNKVEVPTGILPTGYTTQDPKTRTDVADQVSMGGGIVIKKFSDGTYGRFDLTNGGYVPTDSGTYNLAKTADGINTSYQNALQGIYSDAQNAQLTATQNQWNALIKTQQDNASNSSMGIAAAARGNAFFDTASIANSYQASLNNIADLTSKRDAAIAAMKDSFVNNDSKALSDAYSLYNNASNMIQKQIDTTQAKLQSAIDKQDTELNNYIYQQSAKYPYAGLTGMEKSIEEVNGKITSSNEFKQKQMTVDATPWIAGPDRPDPTNADVPSPVTLRSPNALWKDSNDYILSGQKLQSFVGGLTGVGNLGVYKNDISNKSAAILSAAGLADKQAALAQEFKNLGVSGKNQVDFLSKMDRALSAADTGAQSTIDTFKNYNIDTSQSTWANKTLNDLTKQFGDSGDIRAYQSAMYDVGNEFAQLFTKGSIGTQEGRDQAQSLMDGNVKLSDIQKVVDSLSRIGKITVNSSLDQISKIQGGYGAPLVAQYYKYLSSAPTFDSSNVDTSGSGNSSSSTSGANTITTPSGLNINPNL